MTSGTTAAISPWIDAMVALDSSRSFSVSSQTRAVAAGAARKARPPLGRVTRTCAETTPSIGRIISSSFALVARSWRSPCAPTGSSTLDALASASICENGRGPTASLATASLAASSCAEATSTRFWSSTR